MYLRQSNKWKEFLLAEGVEDIGLPPTIAHYLRQQDEAFGPVDNKHLTWIGNLVKNARSDVLLPRENLMEIRRQLKQAVRYTLEARGEQRREDVAQSWDEVFGELWAEALAPLMEYRDQVAQTSPNITDIKKFKKRFMKNLRRLEINPQFIKGFDAYIDNRLERGVAGAFMEFVKPIMLLLAEDPPSYKDLREEDGLRMAGRAAQEILDNPPKAEDQVIHTFDDGYYWYDLRKSACDIEGRKMKHCGSADKGTLYSLRTGEKRRDIKRYITLSMDEDRTVYQIKAKGNSAPSEELWPYLDAFIENAEVKRVTEIGMHSDDGIGFAEMLGHLKQKYGKEGTGQVKFDDYWVDEATELLEQYAPDFDRDDQTSVDVSWPSVGDEEVTFTLKHQAFFPVKDVIVDEDTHRLRWEIRHDAENIVDDTLYPNPRIRTVEVYARGKEDSRSAMLGISMAWEGLFFADDENEDDVKNELELLNSFLAEMSEIAGYLVSTAAAPEEADFDYNAFHERVQKRLEAYGVYRDLAGEIDAEEERSRAQMALPLQESRTIQRWSKIIK